jgi:hypothetical protein
MYGSLCSLKIGYFSRYPHTVSLSFLVWKECNCRNPGYFHKKSNKWKIGLTLLPPTLPPPPNRENKRSEYKVGDYGQRKSISIFNMNITLPKYKADK